MILFVGVFNNFLPSASELIIGEYSPIITEPEANNCFSINTPVIISKKIKRKENALYNTKKFSFIKSARTSGSHFIRQGDSRLIIRDSEPINSTLGCYFSA